MGRPNVGGVFKLKIGPFFVEDQAGNTVIVNSEHYVNIVLKSFGLVWVLEDTSQERINGSNRMLRAHILLHQSLEWLRNDFGDKIVSLKTPKFGRPIPLTSHPSIFFSLGLLELQILR